ncbi:hypothetical protein EGO51_02675 [Haloarcula hispanica]|uniref:Uncharacterized protein n=1 Tax=Haloarcula hispanica TaxID=51589 RepID=A0A5J5LID4_HALHI|nr:hypothetical protein [Haloarcula hispanica]KAA9408731.1 hypothetical protein EGO51_02675 [Haloarcula hispanica]
MVDFVALAKDVFLVLLGSVLGAVVGPYIRNYISKEESKKDEIYRPLHLEISDVTSGDPRDFPYDNTGERFQSQWEEFPEFKRQKVGRKLSSEMRDYVGYLDELNALLSNIENELASRVDESDCLEDAESGVMIRYTTPDDTRTLNPVENFVDKNGPVLFLAENPDDLRELVVEYFESQRLHPYLPFRKLDDEYFELIYDSIESALSDFEKENRDVDAILDDISEEAEYISDILIKKT